MSVPLRDKGKWGLAGMQRAQGTSGVASKRRRGPDRGGGACTVTMETDALPKETLCLVTLAEASGETKSKIKEKTNTGEQGGQRAGVVEREGGKNSQTTSQKR